jgi:transposase
VLGFGRGVVIVAWELEEEEWRSRPNLLVTVRPRGGGRRRCGRCSVVAAGYDQGGRPGGWLRRWRHLDLGFATCELTGEAPRVNCPANGPTVAEVPWARHDSAFTRAFEDLVVWEALASNKTSAARRHGLSWRAVNGMCVRVATEALGRVDLLDGLVAVSIDEVKYKKGQRYLTVVCDQFTGRVVWAGKGRSKDTVALFFAALGPKRASRLRFVSCDGAEWIRTVVAQEAPDAIVCLDPLRGVPRKGSYVQPRIMRPERLRPWSTGVPGCEAGNIIPPSWWSLPGLGTSPGQEVNHDERSESGPSEWTVGGARCRFR